MSKCYSCRHWQKAGETWVSYGDATVKYSDDYACAKDYDMGECPDGIYEPKGRYSEADEAFYEQADYEYDRRKDR